MPKRLPGLPAAFFSKMMTMELRDGILAWISDAGSYERGLALLVQTGYSGVVLSVLQRGENSYTRSKLETCLADWLASNAPVARTVVSLQLTPVGKKLNELQAQAFALMDQRGELKARIRAVADRDDAQGDRRDWAMGIKQLTRDIDAVYEQQDFLDEHGYLPPMTVQETATVTDDLATLMNVRTYISRYRSKLKAAKTDQARANAQKMLEHYEAERDRLEKTIQNHAV